jgi:hypothetical protein
MQHHDAHDDHPLWTPAWLKVLIVVGPIVVSVWGLLGVLHPAPAQHAVPVPTPVKIHTLVQPQSTPTDRVVGWLSQSQLHTRTNFGNQLEMRLALLTLWVAHRFSRASELSR